MGIRSVELCCLGELVRSTYLYWLGGPLQQRTGLQHGALCFGEQVRSLKHFGIWGASAQHRTSCLEHRALGYLKHILCKSSCLVERNVFGAIPSFDVLDTHYALSH